MKKKKYYRKPYNDFSNHCTSCGKGIKSNSLYYGRCVQCRKEEKLTRDYFIQREVWKRSSDAFNPNRATPKQSLKEFEKLQKLEARINKLRFEK